MSYVIFQGDWVRQGEKWFQVKSIVSAMEVEISDGRVLWADEGDIDEVLSDGEYSCLSE